MSFKKITLAVTVSILALTSSVAMANGRYNGHHGGGHHYSQNHHYGHGGYYGGHRGHGYYNGAAIAGSLLLGGAIGYALSQPTVVYSQPNVVYTTPSPVYSSSRTIITESPEVVYVEKPKTAQKALVWDETTETWVERTVILR